MVEQHPRAAEAHDLAHPFAHVGFVAMDGTALAGGFGLAKRAAFQPGVGIR